MINRKSSLGVALAIYLAFCALPGIAAEPDVNSLPKERQQQWDKIKSGMEQEYNVCIEHCGGKSECEQKCRQAHESRLQREFLKLQTAEAVPAANDTDLVHWRKTSGTGEQE